MVLGGQEKIVGLERPAVVCCFISPSLKSKHLSRQPSQEPRRRHILYNNAPMGNQSSNMGDNGDEFDLEMNRASTQEPTLSMNEKYVWCVCVW